MARKYIDVVCPTCEFTQPDVWVVDHDYPMCACGAVMVRQFNHASGHVVGDDIPGGVWIRHGICNADGSPKRYDTHSSMRKAAQAKGLINFVDRGIADKKDYDRLTQRV